MKKPLRFLRYNVSTLLAALVAICGVLTFVVPSGTAQAQGVTSLGTDFWVAFPPNYLVPAANCRLYIGSGTVNTVHVDIYGGSSTPNETHTYQMTPNAIQRLITTNSAAWEARTLEKPEYKAIHIYSQNPVVVYGMSNESLTTDSYLGIPTPALGTDYYPSCYYDDNYGQGLYSGPLSGEFVIVAPYDNTNVTIGPAACGTRSDASGTLSHAQGSTWTVTLMRGQTYLVQSTGLAQGQDDLTGTRIQSNKPISVLSGHQRCSMPIDGQDINGNSKDYVLEMMPPISAWGTEYYDMPMAGRTKCGDEIRLIAAEDGTIITENGKGVAQLNAGEFVDRELVLDPVVYKSNGKKFMTMQHAYLQGFNGDPGIGDPFSICMTPKSQFQKRILFRTLDNESGKPTYTNYGTFICQDDSIGKIKINGKAITAYTYVGRAPIPSTNPPMSAFRVQFPSIDKTYLAECGAPFGLYVYGFSTDESYGNPAGMALNVSSPDTLPPLEMRDSDCGNFTVKLSEVRHIPKFSFEDTKISDFALILDSNDLRWVKASYNYTFMIDPSHPFTSGDSVAYYTLTVLDRTKDAYGAVWTTDRAGNDTVYEYHYYAPKVGFSPASPYALDPVHVGVDSCMTVTVRNTQPFGDITFTDASILGAAKGGKFIVSPTKLNRVLKPNDSLQLQVCFTPSDTTTSLDTLIVNTECVPYKLALEGRGVTPIIEAGDIDFGAVEVGTQKCADLKVRNVGNADLVIDKNSILLDPVLFSFTNINDLPITIKPGAEYVFNFCFHPTATIASATNEAWSTNLFAPYLHHNKDTSFLKGFGIQPGLNWDRLDQGYQVECQDSQVIRVNLENPASPTGADITINKVDIEGPDAADWHLNANSTGYSPLENTSPWQLANGQTIWIDVAFKAANPTDYHLRTAQLVAHGVDKQGNPYTPQIALTGVIRHSTIRIAPATYDFGAAAPGTPLTTTFTIYNDGDTDLVLGNLTITPPFTLTGLAPGAIIPPGTSKQVTVSIVVQSGPQSGTLMTDATTICNTAQTATVTATGTTLNVAGIGHDYQKVYDCQSSTAEVSTSNTTQIVGGKWAFLDKVDIIDPTGQYTFDDGTTTKTLGVAVGPQGTEKFNVQYKPNVKGATNASIVYTWRDTSQTPASIIPITKPLDGIGLHYANVLSLAKKYGDQVYSATTGDVVSLPIQMTTDYDADAAIYTIQMTLRYRRDEFAYQDVTVGSGLTPVTSPFKPAPDPVDNKYELVPMAFTSTTPITPQDTIAHVNLRYVVSVDTVSPFELVDVLPLDKTGASVCWVTQTVEPGTFYGKNLCGNSTIREYMRGNTPTFGISNITPNPISHTAVIDYDVHVNGVPMTIEVFDLLGQKTMTVLDNKVQSMGRHLATFDASTLASGTYVVRMSTGTNVQSVNVVVNK